MKRSLWHLLKFPKTTSVIGLHIAAIAPHPTEKRYSRYIVNRLLENKITLLVIGKNDNWKQKVNLGKKTNQKFTAIPHATFINQLIYKCQLVGIKVITVGEAYTQILHLIRQKSKPSSFNQGITVSN